MEMEIIDAKTAWETTIAAAKRIEQEEQTKLAEQEKQDQELLSKQHIQDEIQKIFDYIKSASNHGQGEFRETLKPKISMEEYAAIGRHLERLGYRVTISEWGNDQIRFGVKWYLTN